MGSGRQKVSIRGIFITLIALLAITGCYMRYTVQKERDVSNTEIKLQAAKSVFQKSAIHFYGAEIDGIFYPAVDILQNVTAYEDGSVEILSEEQGGETVSGSLPAGTKVILIFEKASYRGDVICTFQGITSRFSTYGGYWEQLRIDLSGNPSHTSRNLMAFLCFALLIGIVFNALDNKWLHICHTGWKAKEILLSVSFCILTFMLASISRLWWCVGISVTLSFPLYVALLHSPPYCSKSNTSEQNIAASAITICLLPALVRGTYSFLVLLFSELGINNIGLPFLFLISAIPGLFYIVSQTLLCLKRLWADWKLHSDLYERKFILITGVFIVCLNYLVHSSTNAFSTGAYITSDGSASRRFADIIYGYDHSWLLDSSWEICNFGNSIKHPFLYTVTIIPYSLIHIIASTVEPLFPNGYALVLSLFNAFVMELTALLLRRIVKSDWIAPIYVVTYFYIIMCLGMEQYQLSVFFICLTIYYTIERKNDAAFISSVLMSGATLTSGYLIPVIIREGSFKAYTGKMAKFCLAFLSVSAAAGTVPSCITQLNQTFVYLDSMPIIQRLKVFSHFVAWQFIAPRSSEISLSDGAHAFTGQTPETFCVLGIIILFLSAIAFFLGRHDFLCQICGWSILFSAVLCVGLCWAIGEAWLYVILFSWAYLILLIKLLNRVLPDNSVRATVYTVLFTLLFMYNGKQMRDLLSFSMTYYPYIG